MIKLALLYLTILASLVFTLVPSGYKYGFPLSDMIVSLEYYIYSIYEFIVIIILTGVIASDAIKYRFALWVFFGLMVADLIDWIICYNEIWFNVGQILVSMNILKSIIFGIIILNELWKQRTS